MMLKIRMKPIWFEHKIIYNKLILYNFVLILILFSFYKFKETIVSIALPEASFIYLLVLTYFININFKRPPFRD